MFCTRVSEIYGKLRPHEVLLKLVIIVRFFLLFCFVVLHSFCGPLCYLLQYEFHAA